MSVTAPIKPESHINYLDKCILTKQCGKYAKNTKAYFIEDQHGAALISILRKDKYGQERQVNELVKVPMDALKQWRYREIRVASKIVMRRVRKGEVYVANTPKEEFQIAVYGKGHGAYGTVYFGNISLGTIKFCGITGRTSQKRFCWCMSEHAHLTERVYTAVTRTLQEALEHLMRAYIWREVPEWEWPKD